MSAPAGSAQVSCLTWMMMNGGTRARCPQRVGFIVLHSVKVFLWLAVVSRALQCRQLKPQNSLPPDNETTNPHPPPHTWLS